MKDKYVPKIPEEMTKEELIEWSTHALKPYLNQYLIRSGCINSDPLSKKEMYTRVFLDMLEISLFEYINDLEDFLK